MHSLRTRVIPTAVVLAVLGLGAVVFLPQYSKTGNGNGGDRSVVLTVDFIPVQRRDFDGVIVASTGAPTETVRVSPWIRTVYLKKGARISLTPTQHALRDPTSAERLTTVTTTNPLIEAVGVSSRRAVR